MLEVVFSESVKGSMKVAKNHDKNKFWDVEEICGLQSGQPLEGNPQQVVYIGFNLDVGDISGDLDGKGRKAAFDSLWGHVDFMSDEKEEFFMTLGNQQDKLIDHAKSGGQIRIWKSNAPYSACGFAYVCDILRNYQCNISVVPLPEYRLTSENSMVIYCDWGEVHPGEFQSFLVHEYHLGEMEKRNQSDLWKELIVENSPLRAIVNGKLISVPEDFYDHLIIRNIPDNEFAMVRLIGDILGRYQLGVSDGWYARRIESMIEAGKLQVVGDKDSSHPYDKILRKV